MKIKLDENLPARLCALLSRIGHDVHTVPSENLTGAPDESVWDAAQREDRFLITQDLDFSDTRRFTPGTHSGILLIRLRDPGAFALTEAVSAIAPELPGWSGCFVVLTDRKIRVKRP